MVRYRYSDKYPVMKMKRGRGRGVLPGGRGNITRQDPGSGSGPDPLVRGMEPDPDPDLDLLSSCKNSKKNLDSYYFVTLFDFLSLKKDENVPSKSNKQKK
jgi:hypothetical protein